MTPLPGLNIETLFTGLARSGLLLNRQLWLHHTNSGHVMRHLGRAHRFVTPYCFFTKIDFEENWPQKEGRLVVVASSDRLELRAEPRR